MSWLSDDALARLRSAASAPDLSGTRYELLEEIGRGGMCAVFLAEDPSLGRRVALKVLDVPDPDGDLAERLNREARILARLEHPGIAPVHDVGRLPDGRVYYAMKFVEGPRLDAFAASNATLPERLRVFQRIVEAVAFAHDRGVLHRDLKPENIMVGPFGEVLVMDWGLAKALDPSPTAAADVDSAGTGRPPSASGPHTGHGAVLGTPGYMAPEQARGEVENLDARTDVYALGAVLSFLVSARAPGGGVPRPLLAVCAKAMAETKDDRYPDALALGAEIARYLDGNRVEAFPESLLQKGARLYARHKVAFWLIAAYLAVRGSILFFSGR
jgi:eukaryotic-like serine/threonine-protein kinase